MNRDSMDTFEGFTEEEIQNLTCPKKVNQDTLQKDSTAVYKNLQNKSRHLNRLPRKNVARERLLKGNYNTFSSANSEHLPKEARLHVPQIPEEEEEEHEAEDKNRNITASLSEQKTNLLIHQKDDIVIKEENKFVPNIATVKPDQSSDVNNKPKTIDSDLKSDEEEKKMTPAPLLNVEDANIDALELFETRQKLMEEQNRQRKEILRRALADRTKKTHEEVKRLNEIEGELKKLDLLLSNDVAIIRNQIESASIDFMEAQKRYDRAEKEFLDAKLDLFNKKERKELLTSHLCTIIEQNEMRKAKKLSDLMLQLEIGPKTSLITSQITVEYKTEAEKESPETEKQVVNEQKLSIKNEPLQNIKVVEVKSSDEENYKNNL